MPAEWTGIFVGAVHANGLTIKAVAERAGLHEKYVSKVLHSENPSVSAREKLFSALDEILKERDS